MRILRVSSLIIALAVILTVSVFAAPPVIIQQPSDFYFPANVELPATASFSIVASGDNLSYQWQSSVGGGTFVNTSASGNKTATITVSMPENRVNGRQLFRCIVSNDDGEVVSQVVSTSVGAYVLDSIPQMLQWVTYIGGSIFSWVGSACACIIYTPLLLAGVSFFALGAAIAILSRLLSRS